MKIISSRLFTYDSDLTILIERVKKCKKVLCEKKTITILHPNIVPQILRTLINIFLNQALRY